MSLSVLDCSHDGAHSSILASQRFDTLQARHGVTPTVAKGPYAARSNPLAARRGPDRLGFWVDNGPTLTGSVKGS